MKAEHLLSEEFRQFSTKIGELNTKKKEFDAEAKAFIAEHKARIKAIDEEALMLQGEFDSWVDSQNQAKENKS